GPPPGPPGPRPPPGPAPPAKFGRGSAALRPSRILSSFKNPLLSASHSPNHFSNVPFNSLRVSEPSLSVSAALKRPGPTNLPGPNPPRPGPPGPPRICCCCSLGSTLGGSTSQATSPVFLSSATSRAFSPGP